MCVRQLFSSQRNLLTICFSLITGCCYKFLENPVSVKNGTTKDLVFNLMGVMVKKYNYGLGESTFFVGFVVILLSVSTLV